MIPYGRQSIDDDDIAAVLAVLRSDFLTQGPAIEVLRESPAFAPQVSKILGSDWLTVDDVRSAMKAAGVDG